MMNPFSNILVPTEITNISNVVPNYYYNTIPNYLKYSKNQVSTQISLHWTHKLEVYTKAAKTGINE